MTLPSLPPTSLPRVHSNHPAPPLVSGLRRWIYVVAGTFLLGLGIAGIFLPLVPTTPFLLVASYFYLRSSPRLHHWLQNTRLFGPFLRDWERYHGVRPRVKVVAVVVVLATVTASFLASGVPDFARGVLVIAASIGLTVVARLRTIRETSTAEADELPVQPEHRERPAA